MKILQEKHGKGGPWLFNNAFYDLSTKRRGGAQDSTSVHLTLFFVTIAFKYILVTGLCHTLFKYPLYYVII